MSTEVRTPAAVAYTTWKALFLRGAINSLAAGRTAWFWLLMEPISHIVILMLIFSVLRVRTIGGIDIAVWLMAGLLAFFMFRRTAVQSMGVIRPSRIMFGYPQIKPVDPVLVQACLEGFLMLLVTIIVLIGAGLYGLDAIPDDPLAVMEALLGMWLLGVALGLVNSVAIELFPALGTVITFTLTRAVYFFSGIMIPISVIPYPYRDWLLLNPLVHGVEAVRLGFAPYYHAPSELSIAYLYGWALVLMSLGFSLHVRYRKQLANPT